jgi:hypothetical protein
MLWEIMKRLVICLLIFLLSSFNYANSIELEKKHYLALIVGNYVHGFKEFDTSVVGFEESVSIAIYYDINTQTELRANQLAVRLRFQVQKILNAHEWAKDTEVLVNVYSEDRTGRGY